MQAQDQHWMEQALVQARLGVGLASPNPTVGCVLVKDNQLVAQGFHQYDRLDHAEIVALKAAGPDAKGATAYVTLEPCSHTGRTGPCADALIHAGIARVVIATEDPNPQVQGQGLARLRAAQIEVTTGVLQPRAQRLNDAFAKHIQTGLPYITLKAAMSLDGRIAPPPNRQGSPHIHWITSPQSRQHVHQLRHSADAILTGIGTVLADDPQLTDRSGLPRRRPLLRVVLDSNLQIPLHSKLVQTAKEDLLILCTHPHAEKLHALQIAGVQIHQLPADPGNAHPPLIEVLKVLAQHQVTHALIESGSRLNAAFLNSGLLDRLYLYYAPYFLGSQAIPVAEAPAIQYPNVQQLTLHQHGPDYAAEARLTNYWQPNQQPKLTTDN